MKSIKFIDEDTNLIVKAQISPDLSIKTIDFSLRQKSSKLEKFLLKLVRIYSYDVLKNNYYQKILDSPEYRKLVTKGVK